MRQSKLSKVTGAASAILPLPILFNEELRKPRNAYASIVGRIKMKRYFVKVQS